MSLDKFGHYLNDTSSIISIKNAPKLLGFYMDVHNNIDVQNKRIKNVADALDENDVVNKLFLQTQLEKAQEEINERLQQKVNEIHKENIAVKLSLENQIELLNEKIYRFENYMFASIVKSTPTDDNSDKNILIIK